MKKIKDITGEIYGKLTVIGFKERRGYQGSYKYIWECLCDCGNHTLVDRSNLKSKHTLSCGCLKWQEKENSLYKIPEYHVWRSMLSRCNPNACHQITKGYVDKGVDVCEEWKNSFEIFFKDMGKKPQSNFTIERIDYSLGYTPSNCVWASLKTQANNRSTNKLITYLGKTQTLAQWADATGIKASTINARISKYGWPIETALTTLPK